MRGLGLQTGPCFLAVAHLLWVLIGGDQHPDQVRRDDDAKPLKWTDFSIVPKSAMTEGLLLGQAGSEHFPSSSPAHRQPPGQALPFCTWPERTDTHSEVQFAETLEKISGLSDLHHEPPNWAQGFETEVLEGPVWTVDREQSQNL
ncbi:hypothetical protein E5288_WYG005109 [Bos mutus]|uniref:Uncharacterized protein n=1 Tax=Bos mutus TaxID=72004 RepID=A0A6B0S5Q9_9CETA|nr:hypothetical protein [Bos mutus]